MFNYYKLFNLKNDCKSCDIINTYKIIITKFNNKKLCEEDINFIKNLKKGLYILLNDELRTKYNKLLEKENKIILSANDEIDINLDLLFSNNNNVPETDKYHNIKKKSKETNVELINNRIFQGIHNNPVIKI
jgi:hypothetical protein